MVIFMDQDNSTTVN